MASSRRTATIWLGMGLCFALGATQAQTTGSGMALLWQDPTRGGTSARTDSQVLENAAAALSSSLGRSVDASLMPLAWGALLDDLRALPARLQTATARQWPPSAPREVLLARLVGGDEHGWQVESALIDRLAPALLGYTLLTLAGDGLGRDLAGALAAFVAQTRPGASSAPVERAGVGSGRPAPDASRAADVVRDAPADALEPLRRALLSPELLTGARRKRELRTGPDEAEQLLAAYVEGAVNLAGLGQAAGRPRVFESSFQTLLLPLARATGALDPEAPALKMVCSVFSSAEQYHVEVRFGRGVTVNVGAPQGTWAVWDVVGHQCDQEQTAELGGAVTVRVRPGDAPGVVRCGVQLRGGGTPAVEAREGGRLLAITIPRQAPAAAAEPTPRVVRSFTGCASWYGGDWHGRRTASGERFDMRQMTAAHRTLPLGTLVRVTNTANGRQVELRINDRGPFVGGRVLDVSAAAAQSLGFYANGICTVRVDVLAPGA